MSGNPSVPSEARRAYYLVPKAMKLRYPPMYAELSFDDRAEALVAQQVLRSRGVNYTVYNGAGKKIEQEEGPEAERRDKIRRDFYDTLRQYLNGGVRTEVFHQVALKHNILPEDVVRIINS